MLDPKEIYQYARRLQAYALRRVPDAALAEDLVQDTFVAALSSGAGFRGESQVLTWLTGILKRKIIDYYRGGARQELSLDALGPGEEDGEGPSPLDIEDTHRPGPEAQLESKRAVEALQRRLDSMPPRSARAFLMTEVDGCEVDEICAALGVSAGNLGVILHRVRNELRNTLAPMPVA